MYIFDRDGSGGGLRCALPVGSSAVGVRERSAPSAAAASEESAAERPARRILIIDDHPIVRQGLQQIVENEGDLTICAEAASAPEARTAIEERAPDIIIVDISLKQSDGIELVRDVRAAHPQLPILVLSYHDETIYAEHLLSVGANGYIMKLASTEQILFALRRVLDGGIYVSGVVTANMSQRQCAPGGSRVAVNPIDRLSTRELQILHMVGKGMSTRETAHSLSLSIKTVESHRQRIKRKLNIVTGTQFIQFAINWFAGRVAGRST